MPKLKRLAKDCGFKTVNASEYHDETIRDAFIRGMLSNNVRQRLLEEDDIDLAKAFTQARALETAELQSLSYAHPHVPYNESYALHSPVSIDPSDSGKPDSIWLQQYPDVSFVDTTNTHAQSVQPGKRFAITATNCGQNISEHNINYGKFLNTAKEYGLSFNEDRTTDAARTITLLGFQISHCVISPDPGRFRALHELPLPSDLKSQHRTVGMFAYYSNWISIFPTRFIISYRFQVALNKLLKTPSVNLRRLQWTLSTTKYPLVVETDASDTAIAAILNQDGRPVAFFSRTLNPSERNHSPVEKEAYAIVEALRKWRHYLLGVHFKLLTDQQSVSFVFGDKHKGKGKNDKNLRRRIELSCFSHDVVNKPGEEDQAAGALSRGGPVLLKKKRPSKYNPVVEEVELLDCNPQYAHVQLPNGKEETVSVKHLASRRKPDNLRTSECLADANDLIGATETADEMCSNN
ncbi:uncharacterized protein DEA37_0014814 [Paragonimus westermani]|uniref:Reverse transcriptase RNase H-like domain-containing protein n=1 Tax=Paragonimus westermani TaxID=34504 RepID=A0A5J4NA67_9TREM|nr:uncharacterized protein DEA37_0014814 [Paragonimus westermani]